MRKRLIAIVLGLAIFGTACSQPADRASENLSVAADNFEIQRRVTFINGITDSELLVIEGRCSLGNRDTPGRLSVTCKIGPDEYVKHFLGESDNSFFIAEQLIAADVSEYHHRVVLRPATAVPGFEVDTGSGLND